MPVNDTLTPKEASYIATNAYFTLKDWVNAKPVAGSESRATVQNRVLGAGDIGKITPNTANPTLKGTGLADAQLGSLYTAQTGFGTTSGFGYTMGFNNGRKHLIIATRGTRPELAGNPDLLTDARGAMTGFGDYGPVHKGFKTTFDSALNSLVGADATIMGADMVHCVGHSLGGAVATLLAAHYAARGKAVKLYTFGSPRVGAFMTYGTLQKRIGQDNIFRVAHDLDPISLIGPFPYIHVNPSPKDANNMTLPSPTGSLLSTANHDMNRYIESVGGLDWDNVRKFSAQVDHDNALIARWLLHKDNDPGWVQYASAKTLGLLFKLFSFVLKGISTSLILGLTAIDLLAEVLLNGLYKIKALGDQLLQLLGYAAQWAGIKIASGADFTARMIGLILAKMVASVQQLAANALAHPGRFLMPMPLIIASTLLTSCNAF